MWFLLMSVVFVVLGEAIEAADSVTSLDRDVAEAFVDSRTDGLNAFAPWAAGLADTVVKIAVTAVIAAIMLKVWKRWLEPLVVIVALVLEASVFMLATTIVSRPRPDVVHLQDSPVNSSFPSGHVAAATAYLAIALVVSWHVRGRLARAAVWAVPVLVTAAVAWARLYQGMHFLSDVLFGMVLGIWSVAVAAIVVTRAHGRTLVPDETAPAAPHHDNGLISA